MATVLDADVCAAPKRAMVAMIGCSSCARDRWMPECCDSFATRSGQKDLTFDMAQLTGAASGAVMALATFGDRGSGCIRGAS